MTLSARHEPHVEADGGDPETRGRKGHSAAAVSITNGEGGGATTTIEGFRSVLRPFQQRFIDGAFRSGVRIGACSLPRGNGKSSLVAWLAARSLTPGDPLFQGGTESHIIAASVGQARRTTFKILRRYFDGRGDWKIAESQNAAHIVHKATHTRLSVLPGNSKTAQGLVDCPLVIADEPGAWEVNAGADVWDALRTALGKPESRMRLLMIGTLAPHGVPGNWWHSLINRGSHGSTYVQALMGDRKRWSDEATIRAVNPLMFDFVESRATVLEERDDARSDSRLKASFLSYRLNQPSRDESVVLLTVDDWEAVTAREPVEREGRPICGLDMGNSRAWSSAVGIWPSGRFEAVAVAPGIPDLESQERRDRATPGSYRRLHKAGALRVADGVRVPQPGDLLDIVRQWRPAAILCDRFRLPELLDAGGRLPFVPRVTRWSEATFDIRACRKMAADGPLTAGDEVSRELLEASLSVATVKNDDQGSTRLVKSEQNRARDDVAQALVLACGAVARMPSRPRRSYIGKV